MKRFFFIMLALIIMALLVWKFVFKKTKKPSGPEPVGMTVSKHSEDFNASMIKMVDAYYGLTEAFVNWDTVSVNRNAATLKTSVDSLKLQEMQKDTAIYPTVQSQWEMVKTEIEGLINDEDLGEKRESLNMLSQQIFDLLRIIKYDAAKVYYQECPMALNNYETSGYWLSNEAADEKRRNPYLGLHDPKYNKAMLTCGTTRDSIRTN
jgi:hypothetical protein